MKKVVLKLIACTALLVICQITNVNAEEIYYTNSNGVAMTYEQYQTLLEHYSEPIIAAMPEEQFILETSGTQTKVQSETVYIETKSFVNTRGEITSTEERIITKEEYDAINPNMKASCGNWCWETTYKKLELEASTLDTASGFKMTTRCTWKQLPNIKSYDVIAVRWQNGTSSFSVSDIYGYQNYDAGNQYMTLTYANGNANIKTASNGVGISMNLADDATGPHTLSLITYGTVPSLGTVNFYHTYQHAQSNVSLANSKDYTFSASGLGGVLLFNSSSIQNKYDAMTGLSFTYNRTV